MTGNCDNGGGSGNVDTSASGQSGEADPTPASGHIQAPVTPATRAARRQFSPYMRLPRMPKFGRAPSAACRPAPLEAFGPASWMSDIQAPVTPATAAASVVQGPNNPSGHTQAPVTPATAAAYVLQGPSNPSAVFRGLGYVPAAPSPEQAGSYAVEQLDRSASSSDSSSSDSEARETSHGVETPAQSGTLIPFPGPTVTVTKVGDARN
jgi:hypothetical protein